MRIGIIIPEFPSYTETFFLSQVKGLCERGHEVFVFCSKKKPEPDLEKNYRLKQYKNLRIVDLNITTFGLSGLQHIVAHPVSFVRGWKREPNWKKAVYNQLCKIYMNKFKCNIYHFGYSGTAISYISIMPSLAGKKIVSCRGTSENVKPLTEPGRITKLFEVFKAVDSIHCVSGNMAAVIKRFGAPGGKIFINRPAIDISYFTRRIVYPKRNDIKILTVARLIFQKGLVTGILAIRSLVKKNPAVQWIIAGDGPDLEELAFHINLFELNEHIIMAGRKTRTEIFELYEQCDLFFLPSISEGIANVALEAMAMELPVVSGDAGGISEVIETGKDGIVCSVYDHETMADALYTLCLSYEMRLGMGKQARKKVEAAYSLERYIDVFEEEYGR